MLFVPSFGYHFEELSYREKMTISKHTTATLLVAMVLLLFLPSWGVGQRVNPPGQPQGNPRVAEFFCQWTPAVPTGRTQQQCVQAFTSLSLDRTVRNFCASVGTFCTVSHLSLCPRPATITACRTCVPLFQRVCQQQQQRG
ncbi:uncharacterized protein LOC143285830 [Babylonia areolata]|uniref:uncharacterized protein LOC143285830 n=1 Tax=Babylonia areolata TaxID=304850 RepID=UPI003FCEFCE0